GAVPEQLHPQLRRRRLRALPAAHEVGVALVLGHHGHRELVLLRLAAAGAEKAGGGEGEEGEAAVHARLLSVSIPALARPARRVLSLPGGSSMSERISGALLVLLTMGGQVAAAADWYVETTGNDSNGC